jgi:hypothetical protein
MATRIYKKSLNRIIKIPFQNAEYHGAEFTQQCPKQYDLATAMDLEVPLSALPSLTKLRNIPEGEEKWDCQEQAASTQPALSVLPDGIANALQSNIEEDDQPSNVTKDTEVSDEECINEQKDDETNLNKGCRKSHRKKGELAQANSKDGKDESPLYSTVRDNESLDTTVMERPSYNKRIHELKR